MILIVDNTDSFTYNVREWVRNACNQDIDVINSHLINIEMVAKYNFIIFSPGPSTPQSFPAMQQILSRYEHCKPILGICLGHQAICEYYGAKIVPSPHICHGVDTEIHCNPTSTLFRSLEHMTVGRYHSWIATDIPPTLMITAQNNEGIVMAVEHRHKPIFGVQFHPESFITQQGHRIIQQFLSCSR